MLSARMRVWLVGVYGTHRAGAHSVGRHDHDLRRTTHINRPWRFVPSYSTKLYEPVRLLSAARALPCTASSCWRDSAAGESGERAHATFQALSPTRVPASHQLYALRQLPPYQPPIHPHNAYTRVRARVYVRVWHAHAPRAVRAARAPAGSPPPWRSARRYTRSSTSRPYCCPAPESYTHGGWVAYDTHTHITGRCVRVTTSTAAQPAEHTAVRILPHPNLKPHSAN